ncbi:MAG: hypothetical protein ABI885_11355 [Gammaproteobacteria bacterium]
MPMKDTRKVFALLSGGLLLTAFSEASIAAGQQSDSDRTVVDQVTGKPIANALVVYIWDHRNPAAFHSGPAICDHVEAVPTDVNGVAKMPKIKGLPNARLDSVYKEGMDGVSAKGTLYRMGPSTKSTAERFDLIMTQSQMPCPAAATSNLLQYYRAVRREAESLATTPYDKRRLEGFASEIARLERMKSPGPDSRAGVAK